MSWWETPYKGGPMAVPASMFPRPLYPPDAAAKGKSPSVAGPGCRGVQTHQPRAGRWPWAAVRLRVLELVLAWEGRQRDRLRCRGCATPDEHHRHRLGGAADVQCARVDPGAGRTAARRRDGDGRHGGVQPCAALAFEQFGGEPAPPRLEQARAAARARRRGRAGSAMLESGNNHTILGERHGMDYQPWCAMFVTTLSFVIGAGHDGSSLCARGNSLQLRPACRERRESRPPRPHHDLWLTYPG